MTHKQNQNLLNNPDLAPYVLDGETTGKQLGAGSYGSVLEIKANGLICAGKKMHEVLIDAKNDGAENIAVKYVQECQIMANLRHPNIAQFLGVCFLENCLLPVLLMEKLDDCLGSLLEAVPNIPLSLKRLMLEDVARGLLYLHSHNPKIIHRDLTANNVLLTSSLVAKITDFGNSRIVNLQPGQLARTLSQLPGTVVYMPPEALEASSRYGLSLDIFSFGHLALFVGLQIFPGNLLQHNYVDPENSDRLLGRTEAERRGKYLEQLENLLPEGNRHPLLQLIKDCLRNAPSQRPTAEQLVTVLEEMKVVFEGVYGELAMVEAARHVKMTKALKNRSDLLTAKDKEIQQLRQQLEANHLQLTARLDQHVMTIQQLNTQLREKDERMRQREEQFREEFEQKELQFQQIKVELQQRNADISRLQAMLRTMQEPSSERERLLSGAEPMGLKSGVKTSLSELKLPLKLKWRRGKDMPFGMRYYPQAVVFNGKVYIGGGEASSDRECRTVIVYDPQKDSYSTLLPYTYKYFSLSMMNNQLMVIGGRNVQTFTTTNQVGVWNAQSKNWTHPLPSMTTACSSPSVATHNNRWLVVMGGVGDGICLSRVEILDTTGSGQWYQAAPLPQLYHRVSKVTIGNMCYLLGGYHRVGYTSTKVFSVHMDELIDQAVSQPVGASAPSTPSPWMALPDTSLDCSTALAINGALLAVGGGVWGNTTIFYYYPLRRSWVKAGKLPAKRSHCCCTVLPSGEVLVTGGDHADQRVDITFVA